MRSQAVQNLFLGLRRFRIVDSLLANERRKRNVGFGGLTIKIPTLSHKPRQGWGTRFFHFHLPTMRQPGFRPWPGRTNASVPTRTYTRPWSSIALATLRKP